MKIETYFKKTLIKNNIKGSLSIIVREDNGAVNEFLSIRDIRTRTGRPNRGNTKGISAVSPIPDGKFLIWNFKKFIQQLGQFNPKGGEIGHFYYISDTKTNHLNIKDGKTIRVAIGLHPENDFEGSAGCIVVVSHAQFKKIVDLFNRFPECHIPLTVWTEAA